MRLPRIRNIRCHAKTISLITCHLKKKTDYEQADNKKDKAEQVQSGFVYFPARFWGCYNPETCKRFP